MSQFVLNVAAILCLAPGLGLAEIVISDAYARSSSPTAPSGAAFMVIQNTSDSEDRLVAARTDAAHRVELHTHVADANGVMKMTEIEGGIAVPAQGSHVLKRGGDHVMLMGLTNGLVDGEMVNITLTFETAGDVQLQVPVDSKR
jgi:copper(I)-binding protein